MPCAWLALPSWVASGGILLLCDVDKVDVLDHEIGAFFVFVRCRLKWNVEDWVFVGVYGPNVRFEVDIFFWRS